MEDDTVDLDAPLTVPCPVPRCRKPIEETLRGLEHKASLNCRACGVVKNVYREETKGLEAMNERLIKIKRLIGDD